MSITMYDTVTINTVPPKPPAVAGYVGGWWPTYSPLVAKFPSAHHLSIAVTDAEDAETLDVEVGDAAPSAAPAWVARQIARGVVRPVIYASISVMPSVMALMSRAGFNREDYRIWTAHYTFRPHRCSPACGYGFTTTADATQWNDRALGRNLDQSECADNFFCGSAVPVKNKPRYELLDAKPHRIFGKYYDERALAKRYDRLRATQTPSKHPHRAELAVLRFALRRAAGRVLEVAKANRVNGKPSWGRFHRGWRYQQLIHRAQGARFV